jgi:hypothetical protein
MEETQKQILEIISKHLTLEQRMAIQSDLNKLSLGKVEKLYQDVENSLNSNFFKTEVIPNNPQ